MMRSSVTDLNHSFGWDKHSVAARMSVQMRTPRPTPNFFPQPKTFSTKKSRGTPRDRQPPKPPIKSAPPISRIFPHRLPHGAQQVSFKHSDTSLLSAHYNEEKKELYFDQCFEIEDKLGAGSFGEVFKVRSREDGQLYAIKRSRERFRGESDRRRKLEEVARPEQLPKHPNCVEFVKAWEERQHLYIQTELCKTSLSNLAENNHQIPERLICNYLVDLLMAVKHLHDHELLHMDIKPENIFISYSNVCKLGDFGLVLDLTKAIDFSEAQEGDPCYLAPELMQGRFGKAADIFSLGITILELAGDIDLPRGGELWHQLRSGYIPALTVQGISDDLQTVIRLMMQPDPMRRPSANELLDHPVVRKMWWNRQLDRALNSAMWSVQWAWQGLVSILLTLFITLVYPLHTYLPCSVVQTPHKPKGSNHPPHWDHSFSDDDVFDDEINISNNSMGMPLDLSSSSEDSMDGKITSFLDPRKVQTTPGMRQRSHHLRTPGSSGSPALSSLGSRFSSSPLTSPIFEPQHTLPVTPNSSFHQMCLEEELQRREQKLSIAPKNLMDVFETAREDDDF